MRTRAFSGQFHAPAGAGDRFGAECTDPQRTQFMALSPGLHLGHYDVTALLGEDGMGQVWQATETQLAAGVLDRLSEVPDLVALPEA